MRDTWIQKYVVVSVILLFIGIAVAPSMSHSSVNASQNDDLVEVTTQACGIQGYGDTTVTLTTQQYHDLEQYLVEFRARLNQTSTRQEAVPIFKEAVIELNNYGLLPQGMSVAQAQRLVTGGYQNSKLIEVCEHLLLHTRGLSNDSNFLCLISGSGDDFNILGPFTLARMLLFVFVIYNIDDILRSFTGHHIRFLWNISGLNFEIGGRVAFGFTSYFDWEHPDFHPGNGWVHTVGVNGVKSWSGSMKGAIREWVGNHIGATGFVGFRIGTWRGFDGTFFGTALRVKIESVT